MKGLLQFLVAKIIVLSLASSFVSCYDPSPLQDVCVAVDNINGVYVNGKFCKDPKLVTADDFFTTGLNIPGNTSNRFGSTYKEVDVEIVPGLNTLGVTLVRSDFAPGGLFGPHTHPRASEIALLLEGKLLVGFVSSNEDNNRLFTKVLHPGDVFVFPIGMIHFSINIGEKNAVTITTAGSQNPGYISVAKTVFGSRPLIDPTVLARSFALDMNTVGYLHRVFSFGENVDTLN